MHSRILENCRSGVQSKTCDLSIQHVERVVRLHLGEGLRIDLLDRVSEAFFGLADTERRHDCLVKLYIFCIQSHVDDIRSADHSCAVLIAYATVNQDYPFRRWKRVVSVNVSHGTVLAVPFQHSHSRNRLPVRVNYFSADRDLTSRTGSLLPGYGDNDVLALYLPCEFRTFENRGHHLLDGSIVDGDRHLYAGDILVLIVEQIDAAFLDRPEDRGQRFMPICMDRDLLHLTGGYDFRLSDE